MLPLPQLLSPIRPDLPCGLDPSLTMVLSELEFLLRREVGMVGSEVAREPDWKLVEAKALAAAQSSKDLRIAGVLTAALLRTQGIDGLLSGLRLVRGYLDSYWQTVFPLLDASDGNDATERINAIGNLAALRGSDGDALRIIEALRKVSVLQAPQAGSFSLEHYLAAKGSLVWPLGSGPVPTPLLLEAAAKEAGATAVGRVVDDIEACLAEANAIVSIFKSQCGPNVYPTLDPLTQELRLILGWLGVGAKAVSSPAVAAEHMESVSPASPEDKPPLYTAARLPENITSRDEVIRCVDNIVQYYKKYEPSSPVPFLLKRVRRLVPMDFIQLINELTPEASERILLLTGGIEDKPVHKT